MMHSMSVVVPTSDRLNQLRECLDAVAAQDHPQFEIVVVDSRPTSSAAQEIALRIGATYVIEPRGGASRARNAGAAASNNDIIAFTDDDAIPAPSWLSALAIEFDDPRVMAVTGRVRPLSGLLVTESDRLAASTGLSYSGGDEHFSLDRANEHWFELANLGGLGIGPNMAFRRSAFEVWDGFDERLGPGTIIHGCEESRAFFSLVERGFHVVYTPAALVLHPSPPPSDLQVRARYLNTLTASTAYLTLLMVEEPAYRRKTLAIVVAALRRTSRPWRLPVHLLYAPRTISRWRRLMACLSGPVQYLRVRLQAGFSRR